MGAAAAARVHDPFGHSSAMNGVLIGLAVGALVGTAILTGGISLIAVGAAVAITGGAGLAGEAIGQTMEGPETGVIEIGAPTVLINGRPAAMTVIAMGPCAKDSGPPVPVATGAATVLINGQPAARVGEKMACSAVIRRGSPNVFIGGPTRQVIAPTPEVPAWLDNTMLAMTIGGTAIGTLGVGLTYGVGAAVGSLVGGAGGSYFVGKGATAAAAAMGYGATGQAVAGVAGQFVGGAVGGRFGFKGGQTYDIAANRATAHAFYERQGFKPADIPDHVKGIDLRRPVTVETLPTGTKVSQFQVPGGRQGNYYSRPGTQPTELGIAPQGVSRTTGLVVDKVATPYTVTNDVQVLKSTAAPIEDNWSIPGNTVQTEGGAQQYFTTDKGSFQP